MKKLLLLALAALTLLPARAINAYDLDGKIMAVRFGGNDAQLGAPARTLTCEIEATGNTSFLLKGFFDLDFEEYPGAGTYKNVKIDMPCTINTSTNAITLSNGTISTNGYSVSFVPFTFGASYPNGYYNYNWYYGGYYWDYDTNNHKAYRFDPTTSKTHFTSSKSYQSVNLSTNKQWAFTHTDNVFCLKADGYYPVLYNNVILTLIENNAIAIEYDKDGNACDSYKMRVDKSGNTASFQNLYNLGNNYSYNTYYTSGNNYIACDYFNNYTKANNATSNGTLTSFWKEGTISGNSISIPAGVVQAEMDYSYEDNEGIPMWGANNILISRQDLARVPYTLTGKHTGSNFTPITGKYCDGEVKHTSTLKWDEKSGGDLVTYEYNEAYELGEAYLYLTAPNSYYRSGDIYEATKTLIMVDPKEVTLDVDLQINRFGSDTQNGVYVNATIKPNKNTHNVDHYELMMVPGKYSTVKHPSFVHCPNNGHVQGQSMHDEKYDFFNEGGLHPLAATNAVDDNITLSKLVPYEDIQNPSANPADYSFFVKAVYTNGLEHTFHALATSPITTGIDDLVIGGDSDEEAEKVYFSLDGREVRGELTPGVYVCKQGKKATKVVIK